MPCAVAAGVTFWDGARILGVVKAGVWESGGQAARGLLDRGFEAYPGGGSVDAVSDRGAFADRLDSAVRQRGTPVLVGLDPRADLLPGRLAVQGRGLSPSVVARHVAEFGRGIIDVVAPLVPAIKTQAAFFEQIGPAGADTLAQLIAYGQQRGLLVILDGKRHDIGSTAAAYADGLLGRDGQSPWGADALTVSPYLGDDSLRPFVEVATQRAAGVFVLVKTSNPGGKQFQDLLAQGRPLYRHVEQLAQETLGRCAYGAVGAVVGATYPEQLAELRAAMPHTWFLVPGYGAQGGSARDVAPAFDAQGRGAIINNSRGIIFAHTQSPYAERYGAGRWQEAVEAATRDMIAQLRADTPAGRLVAP